MSTSNGSQFRLEKLKKQAKSLSKKRGITHSEALEVIAQQHGFQSWFECRAQLLKGDAKLEAPAKKVFAHEYDPAVHKAEDVRGVFPDGSGGHRFQERKSILNYTDEFFESINSFRNRLESSIRDIISRSKQHTAIDVLVYINSETSNLINNPEDFFDSILDRYERLTHLTIDIRDDGISIDEFQNLIDSFAGSTR